MPQAIPDHESDRTPRAIFGSTPPRPTVGDAMRRFWPLVLISVLALGALGTYAGYSRKPVYQATSSLSVGLLDLTTQSVPGFAVGGEVVAGGFSRSVQTDAVVVPVAKELHLSPGDVRGRVSSTPVANSPIFTITATGASQADAMKLANAMSGSMVAYGRTHSGADAAAGRLLSRYRQALRDLDRAQNRVKLLRKRQSGTTQATAAGSNTPDSGQLSQARANVDTAQLRVQSIGQLYRNQAGSPASSAVVQPLVDAQGASSDRRSKTELYGAVGVLAGLCLGTALAVLIAGRQFRRRPAP